MSGTQLALVLGDALVAAIADRGKPVRLAEQALDKAVPSGESFGSDNRDDVVGADLASWKKLSTLRTLVELALSSSARIDAVTHAGFSDGFIFGFPTDAGTAQRRLDEVDQVVSGPSAAVVRARDVEAFAGFLFRGHGRLYKASEGGFGTESPDCDSNPS